MQEARITYPNNPENPIKLTETTEAAIRVAGTPLNMTGTFAAFTLERTPLNITSAREKPRPAPMEFTTD